MTSDAKRNFRWGAVLAWVPVVVVFYPSVRELVRATGENKATGLAALAGGWAEGLTMFGLLAFVASEVAGMGLLWRSMSREHSGRSVGAGLSIGCGGLALVMVVAGILFFMRMR